MIAVLLVLATLAVIVFLLNRKVKMGPAMLAGSAIIYLGAGPTLAKLQAAVVNTAVDPGTWEIVIALFFVMCLEYQLRTSGTIDGFMAAARSILRSERILLALMPSFLGFLPSLGGAIFSAPLVESAGKPYALSAEAKTTVNYWFRHVWEFTNPIFTGMLLASQLSGIALGDLVYHMSWITALAFLFGWLLLIAPLKPSPAAAQPAANPGHAGPAGWRFIALAFGPILTNFALVVFVKLSAALSMAIVVAVMTVIFRQNATDIRAMLGHAFDRKLLWGVIGIIFFQNILGQAGVIEDISALLRSIAIPVTVIVGIIALLGGLLTGTAQGFVAISFPFIALLAPGDITLVTIAFLLGTAGQMLSPAHLCLLVTLDYFNADFFKALRPVLILELILVTIAWSAIGLWG